MMELIVDTSGGENLFDSALIVVKHGNVKIPANQKTAECISNVAKI